MTKPYNLCWKPWVHMATNSNGDVKLCCIAQNDSNLNLNDMSIDEVWNSDYYRKIRLDMLNGIQVPSCETCWKEEALGIESHRMISNRGYENRLKEQGVIDIISSTDSTGYFERTPATIDVRLGNTCNLECVMCGPSDSSKWVKRSKHLSNNLESKIKLVWDYRSKVNTSQFDWYKNEKFWEDFSKIAPGLKHITFGGGEPLYIKEHKNIIRYLVDNNLAPKIELHYHTNGTIYDQEVVDMWAKFKEVKVMLSIDGYNEVNSYIRRPIGWDTIESNLRLYDTTSDNIIISINTTVQMLNALYLTTFAKWLLDQNFRKVGKRSDGGIFFASILHYPDYLSIQALPQDAKREVTKMICDLISEFPSNTGVQRLSAVLDFMNADDKTALLPYTLDFLANYNSFDTGKFSLEMLDKYLYR